MNTQHTFFITSRSVLRVMRNVSHKSCRDNQNTHFVFSNFFFLENLVVYGIMWKNIVEPDRPQTTKRLMRISCWVPKATNTHSDCVIRIAFPATLLKLGRLSVTLCIPPCFVLSVVFLFNFPDIF